MSSTASTNGPVPAIQIERHGDLAIIVPANEVESMQWDLIQQAAEFVLAPLKKNPASGVIVDLSQVSFFGSVFLSLLLLPQAHQAARGRSGALRCFRSCPRVAPPHRSGHHLGHLRHPGTGDRGPFLSNSNVQIPITKNATVMGCWSLEAGVSSGVKDADEQGRGRRAF